MRTSTVLACVLVLSAGCGPAEDEEAEAGIAPAVSKAYARYVDGKFDAAGHPFGALVVQAKTGCQPQTGAKEAEGWGARSKHAPGLLCKAKIASTLGGSYVLNVRALTQEKPSCEQTPLLTVRLLDAAGAVVTERAWSHRQFLNKQTYQNLSQPFGVYSTSGPFTVEIAWAGKRPVRLEYIEVFRADQRVVISPPSNLYNPKAHLKLEALNPPGGAALKLLCGDTDQSARLMQLIASNKAQRTQTEFLLAVHAPMDLALAGCVLPTRITAQLTTGSSWAAATSRATYLKEPPPCTFAPGKKRVLLTGFEPFPADSSADNASEQAVLGFDASSLPDVSVMRLVLPVEWDSAPSLVLSTIERCAPDVVISMGQGGWTVGVETTAHNAKSSADVAGGMPDNRGVIYDGEPIAEDAPETLGTGLPVTEIVAELAAQGIIAESSDDAGRYICNDVFYAAMREVQGTSIVAGFVHLPIVSHVEAADRELLQKTVLAVVTQSVAALKKPAPPAPGAP